MLVRLNANKVGLPSSKEFTRCMCGQRRRLPTLRAHPTQSMIQGSNHCLAPCLQRRMPFDQNKAVATQRASCWRCASFLVGDIIPLSQFVAIYSRAFHQNSSPNCITSTCAAATAFAATSSPAHHTIPLSYRLCRAHSDHWPGSAKPSA